MKKIRPAPKVVLPDSKPPVEPDQRIRYRLRRAPIVAAGPALSKRQEKLIEQHTVRYSGKIRVCDLDGFAAASDRMVRKHFVEEHKELLRESGRNQT